MTRLAAPPFQRRVFSCGAGGDTGHFGPNRRDEGVRCSLLDGGDTLLLSVGRVSDEKRLDVLLEAFRLLRASAPGARLLVIGDGPARARLEEATPDCVTFLGELRGDPLARLYASADVFCFPSTTDTFGQVILEAGVSGLPTVAASAGGATELVRHEETGLLVPPDDPAAFSDALLRLVADPYLRLDLGEGA